MKIFKEFTLLAGNAIEDNGTIREFNALQPFNEEIIEFIQDLSTKLLADANARKYPDVVSFAFFCRKANLQNIIKDYNFDNIHIGRGLVFHIAPGNVPVNFAYSFIAGLLAGNGNIVKISSKDFPQVNIIINTIDKLFKKEKFKRIAGINAFVRYGHNSPASDVFSAKADARIIWGGDETVRRIRRLETRPRCLDICFSDRYSIAVINPDSITNMEEIELVTLAEKFYNDTYLFDQNACSAPHTIFWLNSLNLEKGKNLFWNAVAKVAGEKYNFQPIMGVDKLNDFYLQSVNLPIKLSKCFGNLLWVVDSECLVDNLELYRSRCGYFLQHTIGSLNEIVNYVSRSFQTLVYQGFDKKEMRDFIMKNNMVGIDRVCPVGDSTRFSLIWDGYDLIRMLTRVQIVD